MVRIAIQSGTYIDAMELVTNTGKVSGRIGGTGGNLRMMNTNGKRICGVAVRAGANIDRIAFMLI